MREYVILLLKCVHFCYNNTLPGTFFPARIYYIFRKWYPLFTEKAEKMKQILSVRNDKHPFMFG